MPRRCASTVEHADASSGCRDIGAGGICDRTGTSRSARREICRGLGITSFDRRALPTQRFCAGRLGLLRRPFVLQTPVFAREWATKGIHFPGARRQFVCTEATPSQELMCFGRVARRSVGSSPQPLRPIWLKYATSTRIAGTFVTVRDFAFEELARVTPAIRRLA